MIPTDAHVVLGRLPAGLRLGERPIDGPAAGRLAVVADRLEVDATTPPASRSTSPTRQSSRRCAPCPCGAGSTRPG
ncbi:MAG: hypothetical protein U0470_08855 [Anaerolineae bacterium]